MVQEARAITLSKDELVSAFENHRRMTPDFLPTGKLTDCKMTAEGNIVLTVAGLTAAMQPQRVMLKGADILKPLIRYCIENNVILPVDGKKSVDVSTSSATLRISLDLNISSQHFSRPMHTVDFIHLDEKALMEGKVEQRPEKPTT
jgi:hypothetical protein